MGGQAGASGNPTLMPPWRNSARRHVTTQKARVSLAAQALQQPCNTCPLYLMPWDAASSRMAARMAAEAFMAERLVRNSREASGLAAEQ